MFIPYGEVVIHYNEEKTQFNLIINGNFIKSFKTLEDAGGYFMEMYKEGIGVA